MLRERAAHIKVVVGGGGTISPDEIAALERYGVAQDLHARGRPALGLQGMIEDVFARVGRRRGACNAGRRFPHVERSSARDRARDHAARRRRARTAPTRTICGSCRCARAAARRDARHGPHGHRRCGQELAAPMNCCSASCASFPSRNVAVVAIDPTRRRSGGALLGDRIRMNSLASPNVFMRSLATRRQHLATSAVLADVVALYRAAGFDLIVVETAGIGQSDTEIVDLADLSLLRDDGRIRRGEPARENRHARLRRHDRAEQDSRSAAPRMRCATLRKQWRRNHPDQSKLAGRRTSRCSRPSRAASTTRV